MTKPCISEQLDKISSSTSGSGAACATPVVQAVFEAGQHIPREVHTSELADMLKSWPYPPNQTDLLIGGAINTSRAGRLRRLHSLLRFMEKLGVVAKRVLPDADWMTPARMGNVDELPADSIHLSLAKYSKLVSHDPLKTDLKLQLHP